MVHKDKREKLEDAIDALRSRVSADTPQEQGPQKQVSALTIATDLLAGVAVGSFTGYYLDIYFGTKPLWLLICIMLGCLAAFRLIWKEMKR